MERYEPAARSRPGTSQVPVVPNFPNFPFPPKIHVAWHPVDVMFDLKLRRSPRAGVVFVRVFLLLR